MFALTRSKLCGEWADNRSGAADCEGSDATRIAPKQPTAPEKLAYKHRVQLSFIRLRTAPFLLGFVVERGCGGLCMARPGMTRSWEEKKGVANV